MASEEKIIELQEELQNIKWDVIGISEVRRKGEGQLTLRSGHLFYYVGAEDTAVGGVGFLIHRKLTKNIVEIKSRNIRIASVTIKLNKRYNLKIIQAYAPTCSHSNEEVDIFYEDIANEMSDSKTQYTMIIGDFNAKIGVKEDEEELPMGCHGIGTRNERGARLLQFALEQNLYIMNTFFKKPPNRKWTWASPDGVTRNEIDYILSNRKETVQDVSVLNKFSVGSDHRAVRGKVVINVKRERARLVTKKRQRKWTPPENLSEYTKYVDNSLQNLESTDLEKINEQIVNSLRGAVERFCSKKNEASDKLSQSTKELMKKRRSIEQKNTAEYRQISKEISKQIRKDVRKYKTEAITEVIEQNKSLKVLKRNLAEGQKDIQKLGDPEGAVTSDRQKILQIVENFYSAMYTKQSTNNGVPIIPKVCNQGSEEIPEITTSEIEMALREMKKNKAPGEDGIVIESIKAGGEKLINALKVLFNKCLEHEQIPTSWNNAIMIIMHKKGDPTDLKNYRPISLLSQVYKLFIKIITRRLTPKLDFYQPREQAGFRSGYATNDHLLVTKVLVEKVVEYNKPLILIFVDYEKAFDSVDQDKIMAALADCRVDHRYAALIKNIYKNATANVKLHTDTKTFRIERGVRQGDNISPKLFTMLLEFMFKKLEWDNMGINVDGERLNHLRFADDIVLISDNLKEAQELLTTLNSVSSEVGLKINLAKTQYMTNLVPSSNISINDEEIEYVTCYKYLGHELRIGRDNQTCEISRRIKLSWAAFGKLRNTVFKTNIPVCLKRKVFEQCVLPVLTYGAETLTLTRKSVEKIRVTQRAMERSMLGLTLRDRIPNAIIRAKTGTTDAVERIAHMKWNWAGHVARMDDTRWTKRMVEWRPRSDAFRNRGRPPTRWTDDIKRVTTNWIYTAQDREHWKQLREAYVQQWTLQAA